MTREEFIRVVKIQTSDSAVSGTIAGLRQPAGRKPNERDVVLSEWFNRLSSHDQIMVEQSLRKAAELAIFSFLGVIDGISAIEDDDEKGELVLLYKRNNETTLLNDSSAESLHDEYNWICQNPE